MGFFGKIKQALGIGGVKVVCTTPTPTFARSGGTISGTAQLTSKSDQHIKRLYARVIELVHHKEGNETKTKEYDLGTAEMGTDITIKAGETKSMDFQVTYTGGRNLTDKMQAQGGALKAMGKIGAFAAGEKSEYRLRVDASVKGAMLAANGSVLLKPV